MHKHIWSANHLNVCVRVIRTKFRPGWLLALQFPISLHSKLKCFCGRGWRNPQPSTLQTMWFNPHSDPLHNFLANQIPNQTHGFLDGTKSTLSDSISDSSRLPCLMPLPCLASRSHVLGVDNPHTWWLNIHGSQAFPLQQVHLVKFDACGAVGSRPASTWNTSVKAVQTF